MQQQQAADQRREDDRRREDREQRREERLEEQRREDRREAAERDERLEARTAEREARLEARLLQTPSVASVGPASTFGFKSNKAFDTLQLFSGDNNQSFRSWHEEFMSKAGIVGVHHDNLRELRLKLTGPARAHYYGRYTDNDDASRGYGPPLQRVWVEVWGSQTVGRRLPIQTQARLPGQGRHTRSRREPAEDARCGYSGGSERG
jgi:hypothetical protein